MKKQFAHFWDILHRPAGLTRAGERRARRNMEARIEQVLTDWVSEGRHLLPFATMEEAAEDMGIGKDQLSQYFSNHGNTTFLKWRKEQRIAEAKRLLLENPDISLSELGSLVGITDRSNMRRQFQEVTGLCPSEWLRRNC